VSQQEIEFHKRLALASKPLNSPRAVLSEGMSTPDKEFHASPTETAFCSGAMDLLTFTPQHS